MRVAGRFHAWLASIGRDRANGCQAKRFDSFALDLKRRIVMDRDEEIGLYLFCESRLFLKIDEDILFARHHHSESYCFKRFLQHPGHEQSIFFFLVSVRLVTGIPSAMA